MTKKRPFGVMTFSVLLLLMALRALGWVLVSGLTGGVGAGMAGGLVNLPAALILIVCAVGLLRLREWARWLTLAVCSLYFGVTLFNVVAAWPGLEGNLALGLVALNGAEAVLVLASVWWYLNRREVRKIFF